MHAKDELSILKIERVMAIFLGQGEVKSQFLLNFNACELKF